jgi:hypothetical protein
MFARGNCCPVQGRVDLVFGGRLAHSLMFASDLKRSAIGIPVNA